MALINCQECSKEMSDTLKKCPNCGYSLKKKKELPMKKISIGVVISLVVVMGLVFAFNYNNIRPLSEKEKAVLTAIQNYKTLLKNPESLQVHQARYILEDGKVKVFFELSAQNGFGGLNRNITEYVDGKYYGNTAEAGKTITKYTSTEDSLEIILADIIKSSWDKVSIDDSTIVKIEKINKELNNK